MNLGEKSVCGEQAADVGGRATDMDDRAFREGKCSLTRLETQRLSGGQRRLERIRLAWNTREPDLPPSVLVDVGEGAIFLPELLHDREPYMCDVGDQLLMPWCASVCLLLRVLIQLQQESRLGAERHPNQSPLRSRAVGGDDSEQPCSGGVEAK